MRHCICSRPAVKRMSGEWVCQVCVDLESARRYQEKRSGIKEKSAADSQLDWNTYWTENLNWGSVLMKLEGGRHV